ncbi:MAG TPA: hypothetical protein VGO86_05660 [Candidatus Dormibacteraeota bacterium]|jgi:hypothetical protein
MTGRLGVLALLTSTLLGAACGGQPPSGDPSAPYFHEVSPPPATAAPDAKPPVLSGPIARPNHRLTPGVIATRDATVVCQQPIHVKSRISYAEELNVLALYGISVANEHNYGLDYLVPLQLGGADVQANLWPAPLTVGVGYHEKEQLNYRIRTHVCQGDIPLDQAQQQMISDWSVLYAKYAAGKA